MSLETVEREFETRTKTLFETVHSVPVDYGQSGFTKPETWMRQTILGGLEVGAEVDATSYELSGSLEVQIFTKNRRENARLFDLLAAGYRDQTFSGIYTYNPLRIVVGDRDGYWQTNLTVEWEITTLI